ncbi:uncharacterized protein LOC112167575 isoform X2 [Rosa chinensis]|nr:uncharacterized protein LOC112167575 isoform X2 [Rosa chinensis]
MENQPSTWRYFRIDGEPLTYKGDANEKGSQNVQQDGNANDEHRMQNAQQCGNSNGHSSQNVHDEEHHEIPSQQSLAKAPFISSQPLPSPLNFSQEIPPVQRSSQPIGSFLASFSMTYTDPVTRRPKKQVAFRNPKNSMSTENASKPIWRP